MAQIRGARGTRQEPGDDPFGRGDGGPAGGGRGAQAEAEDNDRLGPAPLGVHRDYRADVDRGSISSFDPNMGRATHGGQTGTVSVAPRYFDGDQFMPQRMSPAEIWELQQLLVSLGLLTGRFQGQVWDPATADAYAEVLSYANQQGLTEQQALMRMAGEGGGTGGFRVGENGELIPLGTGAEAAQPLPIRQTDPEVLASVFRRGAIELTGEGWNPDQIQGMVSAYQQMEVERQRAAFTAQNTPGESTYMDIPSPEQFAESHIRNTASADVQSYEGGNFAAEAAQLLASPAWGIGGAP